MFTYVEVDSCKCLVQLSHPSSHYPVKWHDIQHVMQLPSLESIHTLDLHIDEGIVSLTEDVRISTIRVPDTIKHLKMAFNKQSVIGAATMLAPVHPATHTTNLQVLYLATFMHGMLIPPSTPV